MSWPAKCSLPVAVRGSKTLHAAPYNVKQDAFGNTDGNIFFTFPDWCFRALIFSVVNAAAKRRSKFPFNRSQ